MTSVSRDSNDIRKSLSGERSVSSLWLQSCRQEGPSKFRNVRSKPGQPDQEKVAASDMSRARNVNDKDFQEITQSTAVPARRSGVVPIGHLVLIGSSLSRNFRHPACPGSTCIHIYIIYVYKYHYISAIQKTQP